MNILISYIIKCIWVCYVKSPPGYCRIEGGTFVKLVANKEIEGLLESVEPNTVKTNRIQLNTPTLKPLDNCYNSLRTVTGLGQKVLSNYEIFYDSFLATLWYHMYSYNTDSNNSYNSGGASLFAGQLLIEYFVPSTDDPSDNN